MSIIGVCHSKDMHKQLFYNTTTSQTSQKGTVKYVTDDKTSNEPYLCKVDENGNLMDDFKVMSTTDMHLFTKWPRDSFSLEILSKFIDQEQPDLVVLDGDTISHKSYTNDIYIQQNLVKMFENKKQYWTFVLGNHDGQKLASDYAEKRKIGFDTLCGKNFDHTGEQSKYCLAQSKLNVGNGTNYINIRGKNKKIIQTLFFFDCDTIETKNQAVIDWYNQALVNITNDNGGVLPPSIAYNHIPFAEMKYGYDNINKDSEVEYIGGGAAEQICSYSENNGLFDAFVNSKSTHTVIFGHDHVNNISLKYKNIRLMYSLGLPYHYYTIRCDRKWYSIANNLAHIYTNKYDCYLDGITNVFIKDTNTTPAFGNVYAQNTNVFNGLKFKLFCVCYGFITHKSTFLVVFNWFNLIVVWGGIITCITFLIIRKKKHIN